MSHIPDKVSNGLTTISGRPLNEFFFERGYALTHRGKVRDTYGSPKKPGELVVVASDRLSIFDFVLPALVPGKGEVLTQMSKFAMSFLSREVSDFRHHLLPDDFTSFGPDLPSERVTRVRQLNMWDAEIILRAYLGGSVWGQYQQTGLVAGQQLGTGLRKWEKMHPPLFTPSTKAKVGHDQNITQDRFYAQLGARARDGIDMFTRAFMAYSTYVERHGFTLLDTKGEIGYEGDDQYAAVVADEIFTPDCSRFTTSDDLALARKEGRDPVAYDKQLVRAWGMTVETPFGFTGIHRLDPENPEHLAFVDSLQVPQEVLEETAKRYREICRAITGIDLR